MADTSESLLQLGVNQLQLETTIAQRDALLSYVALLHQWNKAYNLTAIKDPGDMVVRHILDSL